MLKKLVNEKFHNSIVREGKLHDGTQILFRFENNYGVSLVKHSGSYGNEMAIVKFNSDDNDDWAINYSTPITDDVLGHLSQTEINLTLLKCKDLI